MAIVVPQIHVNAMMATKKTKKRISVSHNVLTVVLMVFKKKNLFDVVH